MDPATTDIFKQLAAQAATFAQEATDRQTAAQEVLAAQIAANGRPGAATCGAYCGGQVEVNGLALPCPLAQGTACPWAEEREMTWRRRVAERLRIGKRHLGVKVEHVAAAIRPAVTSYLADLRANLERGTGLVLMGEKGCGKTGIATLVVLEAARLGLDVENWYVPRLVNSAVGNTFSADSRADVAAACRTCDLLVLDDLGVESATAWWLEWLDGTVDERYREERATVVTTNLDVKSLAASQQYSRMASRWAEPGVAVRMNVGKEDRRKELAEVKSE